LALQTPVTEELAWSKRGCLMKRRYWDVSLVASCILLTDQVISVLDCNVHRMKTVGSTVCTKDHYRQKNVSASTSFILHECSAMS
jgi:hypothetical protein